MQAWSFNIPTIAFTDSQLHFRDESLPISFDGIDLVRLTPYSGTYAGNRLQGDNSIVIQQLKL